MSKLIIKTKWSEVNIKEWIQIGEVESNLELNGLNIAKRIKIAAILSNRTEQEISEMSGEMWGKIAGAVSFVEKAPRKNKKKEILINGTRYIFHPNPNHLTAGEMASVEQMLVDQQNGGETATAGILSILVRPAIEVENKEFNRTDINIEPFTIDNLEERKNLFLDHLTVDKIWHEWAFFFNIGKKLGRDLVRSTQKGQKVKRGKK